VHGSDVVLAWYLVLVYDARMSTGSPTLVVADFTLLLQRLLAQHPTSSLALATQIGVSDRVVRKWITGTCQPAEEHFFALKLWLEEDGCPLCDLGLLSQAWLAKRIK
jgi:hypothetical protein